MQAIEAARISRALTGLALRPTLCARKFPASPLLRDTSYCTMSDAQPRKLPYYDRLYPHLGPPLHDEPTPFEYRQTRWHGPFFSTGNFQVVQTETSPQEASTRDLAYVEGSQPLEVSFNLVKGPALVTDRKSCWLVAVFELARPWAESAETRATHPILRVADFASDWAEDKIPIDGTRATTSINFNTRRATVRTIYGTTAGFGDVHIRQVIETWRRTRLLQITFSLIHEYLDPNGWALYLAKTQLLLRHHPLFVACHFTRFLVNNQLSFINHGDQSISLQKYRSEDGFIGIVASGSYTGGELVIPKLRLVLEHKPGLIIVYRASLDAYIRPATGQRRSIVLSNKLLLHKNICFQRIPDTTRYNAYLDPDRKPGDKIGVAWRSYDHDDPDAPPVFPPATNAAPPLATPQSNASMAAPYKRSPVVPTNPPTTSEPVAAHAEARPVVHARPTPRTTVTLEAASPDTPAETAAQTPSAFSPVSSQAGTVGMEAPPSDPTPELAEHPYEHDIDLDELDIPFAGY